MKRSVNVAGAGIISCLGSSWAETAEALQRGESGLSEMQLPNSKIITVGQVKIPNEELAHRVGSNHDFTRTVLLGLHAAKEAYLQSGIQIMERWRVGMVSATMGGGMDKTEQFYPVFLEDSARGKLRNVVNHYPGKCTELMADALNIRDIISTVNTGSASALNAIMYGARLIAHDKADVIFAGGTDALTRFAMQGLDDMGLCDNNRCRPFDETCAGLNVGEGAAFIVLVSDHVVRDEGIGAIATLSGYASSNFIHNAFPSTVKEEAAFQAMDRAIQMAGLHVSDIDYVNLFGTGVPDFDLIEAAAIHRLFGNQLPKLSSTKGFTGFTSGASGAIEAVIALMSLSHQCVYPNAGFEKKIPEVGILPEQQFNAASVQHTMVNSFSFHGNCSSIVLSKALPQTNFEI
ncbi:MAG TPA: beta-ketoacyl synthase N-terminal-like domain-containing protein [Ohtaekwangia sp.]|nr:beta-ketoacyl synthase N-terminal-like domain-containing protein [Ohtaekwangia sp.]